MSISTVITNRVSCLAGITLGLVAGALHGLAEEYRYILAGPAFPCYSTPRQFTDIIKPGEPLDLDVACDYIMDEIGSEIDMRNGRGETALIIVAMHYWGPAQTALIELLLAAGADINASTGGLTPLMAHIKHGFRTQYANMSVWERVTSRISRGDVRCSNEVVKMLINGGADIDLEVKGRTALYTAITEGNIPVVKILLDAGATPGIYSHKMYWFLPTSASAITVALSTGFNRDNKYEMVASLLDAGADVNYRSFYSTCGHQYELTPLILVLQYYEGEQDDALIELLLKAKAEITMLDGTCVLTKICQDTVRSATVYKFFKKYHPLLEIDYSRVPTAVINEVHKMDGEYEYWHRLKTYTVMPSIQALNQNHE